MKTNSQGSILAGVMMTTLIIAIVAASVMSLLNTQRRINVQRELQLQANAAAETALDYVYSYIINDIERHTLANSTHVPAPAASAKTFPLDDLPEVKKFLLGNVVLSSGIEGTPGVLTLDDLEVRVLPPTQQKRYRVDGNDPANANDPNKDQWVNESLVPIVAKVTARQGKQHYTAYVHKGISTREIALFQYSIFFQGQLHLHRGFRPMGGVHANGNLFLNAHNGDGAIYNGAVTTASHFYRGSTFDGGGTGADAFGYVPVDSTGRADFSPAYSVKPVATGGSSDLRIYTETSGTTHKYVNVDTTLDSRKATWKEDATKLFKGHLEDRAHLVPELTPVGSEGYRQDVKATTNVNEFNNAPYALIEPNLPVGHESHKESLENSLQAKASLIFIVEHNDHVSGSDLRTTNGTSINGSHMPGGANPKADYLIDTDDDNNYGGSEPRVANPWKTFIVRAYKVSPNWDRSLGTDIHGLDATGNPYLQPIPLPSGVIGAADPTVSRILSDGVFEDFDIVLEAGTTSAYSATGTSHIDKIPGIAATSGTGSNKTKLQHNDQRVKVVKGLFDSRLGRPVVPLTINIAKLKYVLEAPIGSLTGADRDFREAFDPTENIGSAAAPRKRWNGLVYVEFPTSLVLQNALTPATNTLPITGAGSTGASRRFAYGTKEKRHPDRWFHHDHESRGDRADSLLKGIVPLAPELRDYPDSNHVIQESPSVKKISSSEYGDISTILNERYAIPALQIINGRELPHPNKSDPQEGFTIATNAPVYLVGNYNSDGDHSTGTKISDTSPDAYSVKDPGIDEIPAAIFCDTFTVLSNGWGEVPSGFTRSNRENSFYGKNNGSTRSSGSTSGSPGTVGSPPGRPARERAQKTFTYGSTTITYPKTKTQVEISACIATGEYPIFEFFTHALEDWRPAGGTPIVVKGSLVGMYHAEIQHIKQAYGRTVTKDIQTYYNEHGAYAFVSSRYHKMLYDGDFPPGTPMAYVTAPREFRLLRRGDPDDEKLITDAGF